MEIKKVIFFIFSLLLLNGCLQSTAMVGPSISIAGGGSIYQTSLSYSAGKIFEEQTGMTTTEFVISTLDNKNERSEIKDKKLKNDLYKLVKSNLETTRQKLIINSDTN